MWGATDCEVVRAVSIEVIDSQEDLTGAGAEGAHADVQLQLRGRCREAAIVVIASFGPISSNVERIFINSAEASTCPETGGAQGLSLGGAGSVLPGRPCGCKRPCCR
ncbi:hypothetical protein GCM10023203_31750 [Actinomycetospora straminea]|uniref:Uncharacterized protein n=1 Tax=Actinomycetospora straminea TaxID=663607 RepID=A0ABP9EIT6_9PSEU